jgi:hypothetical protein
MNMIRNLVPILLLGLLAAAAASVLIGTEQIEQWMGGGVWAYVAAVVAGIFGARDARRKHCGDGPGAGTIWYHFKRLRSYA